MPSQVRRGQANEWQPQVLQGLDRTNQMLFASLTDSVELCSFQLAISTKQHKNSSEKGTHTHTTENNRKNHSTSFHQRPPPLRSLHLRPFHEWHAPLLFDAFSPGAPGSVSARLGSGPRVSLGGEGGAAAGGTKVHLILWFWS